MFNRRVLLALVACLAVSCSSAMAGGGGGTKKDSTIKVVNNLANPIYAFVDVADDDILAASMMPDPIAEFKKLGGMEVAAGGGSVKFSVKAGDHFVTAVDIVEGVAVGKKSVTTTKGKTATVGF